MGIKIKRFPDPQPDLPKALEQVGKAATLKIIPGASHPTPVTTMSKR